MSGHHLNPGTARPCTYLRQEGKNVASRQAASEWQCTTCKQRVGVDGNGKANKHTRPGDVTTGVPVPPCNPHRSSNRARSMNSAAREP